MHTPFDVELPIFDVATPMGRGLLLVISHMAPSQGDRLPALQILGVYAYTLCRRTTKFDVVTRVGEGRVSWGQTRTPPIPKERSYGSPMGSPVFMPTPFNAERPNSALYNTYGEGRVFRRSATPLYLHKCVARFVSES